MYDDGVGQRRAQGGHDVHALCVQRSIGRPVLSSGHADAVELHATEPDAHRFDPCAGFQRRSDPVAHRSKR
jgi:hypothetical protein